MSGGHYVAYVRYEYRGVNNWFYMSDSSVNQVSEEEVFSQEAYILFYERILA